MKNFLERYIEEFGSSPASDNAFRAYDGVMMIAEAMEAAQADRGEALRQNRIGGAAWLPHPDHHPGTR